MAEMLFDSSMLGPASPPFHGAHECKAAEQNSKPAPQQDIQPTNAAFWHFIGPPFKGPGLMPVGLIIGANAEPNRARNHQSLGAVALMARRLAQPQEASDGRCPVFTRAVEAGCE
jgi:hypothetical protein